jgi:hypothetical protein
VLILPTKEGQATQHTRSGRAIKIREWTFCVPFANGEYNVQVYLYRVFNQSGYGLYAPDSHPTPNPTLSPPWRVIDPTPPPATLPGFHLLIFSHASWESVGDHYGSGTFFSPNCSIVQFRPCGACCFFLQYLWRGSLCLQLLIAGLHTILPNNPHCVLQQWRKQRWRKH